MQKEVLKSVKKSENSWRYLLNCVKVQDELGESWPTILFHHHFLIQK